MIIKTVFFPILLFLPWICLANDVTVGIQGEYKTISEAVAAGPETTELLIELLDPVHTECGIEISRSVTVYGKGMEQSVIQADTERGTAEDRVFKIRQEGHLELRGLTLRYGRPSGVPLRGGGIDNEGFLRMENCALTENDAVYGAGLFTRGRTELTGCVISDNRTFKAPLEIARSGIGCTGSGGGIKTESGGDLLIENCAFINNYSQVRGGGIFIACESAAEIINCIFFGNSADRRGGGICNKGDLFLLHSTLTNNRSVQRGSGLCNMGKASVQASLLSNNSYGDFANIGTHGIYGEGFMELNIDNFCADGSMAEAQSGNARLKSVRTGSNGLPYIAIGIFSPARNAVGSDRRVLSRDARGVLRDFRPDIGAYEFRPIPWR